MQVCSALDVPLEVVPLTQEYWQRVVEDSISTIKAGRTPNPDILCNSRCVDFLERQLGGGVDMSSIPPPPNPAPPGKARIPGRGEGRGCGTIPTTVAFTVAQRCTMFCYQGVQCSANESSERALIEQALIVQALIVQALIVQASCWLALKPHPS